MWCFSWSATLEQPTASVSSEEMISLLQSASCLLTGFSAINVLADRGISRAELLGWFARRSRRRSVMWLRPDT